MIMVRRIKMLINSPVSLRTRIKFYLINTKNGPVGENKDI